MVNRFRWRAGIRDERPGGVHFRLEQRDPKRLKRRNIEA